MMKLIGALIVLGGWVLTLAGLFISTATNVRGGIALLGIAVSLFGIFGVLNPIYLKNANWKS
jgi:hypothetical protein